jgi:hypothetical protein
MKSIDKAVELFAQTTRNVFKRKAMRFVPRSGKSASFTAARWPQR